MQLNHGSLRAEVGVWALGFMLPTLLPVPGFLVISQPQAFLSPDSTEE